MTVPRHKWGKPDRTDPRATRPQCTRGCGMTKVTRKEPPYYWTEFWRGDQKISVDKTPPCEPISERAA